MLIRSFRKAGSLFLCAAICYIYSAPFARGEQPGITLPATTWVATCIEGNLVKGRPPILTITGDRASGNGGCNRYSASVELGKDDKIRFGPVASTRMACTGADGTQEPAYFKALASAVSYHITRGYLVLLDSQFNKVVEFSAKQP